MASDAVNRTYRRLTVDGVPRNTWYAEKSVRPASPLYAFGPNIQQGVRNYYLRWASGTILGERRMFRGPEDAKAVPQMVADFLGYPTLVNTTPKYISRVIPDYIPNFSGGLIGPEKFGYDGFLFAEQFQGGGDVPTGVDTAGTGQYDEFLASVTYNSRPYRIVTDQRLSIDSGAGYPDESSLLRHVSYEAQPSVSYQTVPTTTRLVWADQKPVLLKKYVIFCEGDVLVTWHQVPVNAVPQTAIKELAGKCNNVAFGNAQSVVPTYTTEQLLYITASLRRYRWHDGQWLVDVTHKFKYYPYGANNWYRYNGTNAGTFQEARYSDGSKFFPTGDFTRLFKPEP